VTLPFEDGAFDAVASAGVLEHVRETGGDELASLREINRVLEPGGTFPCFHFPNRYSWIDMVAGQPMPTTTPTVYTTGDIASLVKAADMRLLETRSYGFLPAPPPTQPPPEAAQVVCTNHLLHCLQPGLTSAAQSRPCS
jgi:SAM-dependent methyltransferase